MSAAVTFEADAKRAADDLVSFVRGNIRDAVKASEAFPDDPRLAKAQMLLVGALAEIVKYENQIGGPK